MEGVVKNIKCHLGAFVSFKHLYGELKSTCLESYTVGSD